MIPVDAGAFPRHSLTRMAGLFKSCDVRGVYGADLTDGAARRIGNAFAAWLRDMGMPSILVGGDVRVSTPALKKSLIEGLVEGGADVVDVGIVPTPVLHFADRTRDSDAALMVTASHNPPEFNGIKFSRLQWPLLPEDLAAVERLTGDDLTLHSAGAVEVLNPLEEYQSWILGEFAGKLPAMRVVVDAGGGCWSGLASRYLKQMGLEVIALGDTPDGHFRRRPSNSSSAAALRDLRSAVVRERAALGIAFDGDGDRVNFIDETGVFVEPDVIGVLLMRHALAGGSRRDAAAPTTERPWAARTGFDSPSRETLSPDRMLVSGKTRVGDALRDPLREAIIYDIKCSRAVPEEVVRLGGNPVRERTGYTFLRHRMRCLDAPFGVEMGGHYYWRELIGCDDGLYTALRLLTALKDRPSKDRSLSHAAASVEQHPATPELRIPCAWDRHRAVCEFLAATFSGDANVDRLDGVLLEFESAWALVRPSVTEPMLTIRFEGRTEEDLEDVIELVSEQLPADVAAAVREAAGD